MKKLFLFLACGMLSMSLHAELFKPEFAGHRGCNQGVENTRQAFITGAQRGYEYLETDLKVTSDRQYVCWHDDDLTRVSSYSTPIQNSTLAQLQALTLTQTRNGVTYTAQITTIGEYLDICREYGCKAILELKWSLGVNSNDCSGIPAFLNYCEQHLSLDSIIFLTSMKPCLTYIRNMRPTQPLMFLCYNTNFGDATFNFCNDNRIDVDVSGGTGVDAISVKRFHDAGLKVGVWTIDNTSGYNTYAGAHCDVVTTNALIPTDMSPVELIDPVVDPNQIPVTQPTSGVAPHIYAYDLNVTEAADDYVFTFTANTPATAGAIEFYKGTDKVGEIGLTNVVKGSNSRTVAKEDLPGASGETMTWKIRLHADAISNWGFAERKTAAQLGTTRLGNAVNVFPETDHFGDVYLFDMVAKNTTSNGLYILDPEYNKRNTTIYSGGINYSVVYRIAIDAEGYIWIADFSDPHAGFWVVNPDTPNEHVPFFLNATNAASGLLTNPDGVAMGSSVPTGCFYGTGADTKLIAYNEDAGGDLLEKCLAIYNIGQEDGSIAHSWSTAPSRVIALDGQANGNGNVHACSHGVWVSQHRSDGNNTATATSLRFYTWDGECTYMSHTAPMSGNSLVINGSLGSCFAVTPDESTLIFKEATTNFLVFDIAWEGDTPTLTHRATYAHGITGTYGLVQMNWDYAGNLIATGAGGLAVISLPTNNNTCTTPAKSSMKVTKPGLLAGTYKPEFAGHRGCNQGVENTREAFINGARRGYQYLETDLKVTADQQYVCWHDDNLDRVTTSGISIPSTNLADLQALTLTQTRNGVTYTAQITTIGEYLDICREYHCKAILELKWSTGINSNDCSGIPAFLTYCEQHLSLDSITFLTSMKPCLTYIRNMRPTQPLMLLVNSITDAHYDYCVQNHIDIDCQSGGFTKADIERFHEAGLRLGGWTIDDAGAYAAYSAWRFDIITTNALIPANLPAVEVIEPSTLIPNTVDYPDQTPEDGIINSQALTTSHHFPLPDFLNGTTIRRAILRDGKWYVLANQDNTTPILTIIDPLTGLEIQRMNLTGVEGGQVVLNDIAFTADGVLLACNKEAVDFGGGEKALKIYRWDNDDAAPQVLLEVNNAAQLGNWESSLAGITMSVSGTLNNENDSLLLYVANYSATATREPVYRIAGLKMMGDTLNHFCYALDNSHYKGSYGWKEPLFYNSPNSQNNIILYSEKCQPTEYTFLWNGTRIPMEERGVANDEFAPIASTALAMIRLNEQILAVTAGNNDHTQLMLNDISNGMKRAVAVETYETSLPTTDKRSFTGIEMMGNDMALYVFTTAGMEIISNHDFAPVEEGLQNVELSTRIYPNPTSDYLTIQANQIEQIALYNIEGQSLSLVWNGANSLIVSHLNEGLYILQINGKSHPFVKSK